MTLGCQPTRVKEADQLHFSHIFHLDERCCAPAASAVILFHLCPLRQMPSTNMGSIIMHATLDTKAIRFIKKILPYRWNNTVSSQIFPIQSIEGSWGRGWSNAWIKLRWPISSIDQVRCCITLEVTHFNNRSHGLAPNLAVAHGYHGRRFAWWVGGVHRSSLLRAGPNVCVCECVWGPRWTLPPAV